jgi:CubicO group peptidase (beta-lactamase class C family)
MWTSDTIHERLKAYEYELPLFMRDHHIPGLSLAITNRQEVVYATAYGARQLAHNLPNTVETLHGIGSVSKSFTCLAVLQLAEQGKLSVEDPLKQYLDVSVDKDAHAPIRIRHLMSHTSGIPDLGIALVSIGRYLLDVEPFIPLSSDEDLFRYVNAAHENVLFPPGKKYFYFNGGFTLLAKMNYPAASCEVSKPKTRKPQNSSNCTSWRCSCLYTFSLPCFLTYWRMTSSLP